MARDRTKITSPDKLATWNDRIQVASNKMKAQAWDPLERWRELYKGNQSPINDDIEFTAADWQVIDNIIYSNIRTIMPSINFRNPKMFVSPKKKPYQVKDKLFDTMSASVGIELLLNYYYKELELKRTFDKTLLNSLIGPWGIVFIGYTLETEKVNKGEKLEVDELIKAESPFIVNLSPKDLIIDPEAKDPYLNDAEWIGIKWIKRLEDVKNNPKYDKAATKELKTNITVETSFNKGGIKNKEHTVKGTPDKKDWERVEGWDIYDKKNGRLLTIVSNHDKVLQNSDWPLSYEGFPIETLFFDEVPDELIPLSSVELSRNNQEELNKIRDCQLSHIRRISQRRYAARKDSIENDQLDKLKYGGDGTIVFMDDPSGLLPIKDATISQDIYLIQRGLKDANREVQGIAEMEQGVSRNFETATEPTLLAQGSSIKRDERSGIFEAFIVRVMRKLHHVIQQTADKDIDIPLTDTSFNLATEFIPSKLEKIIGAEKQEVYLPWLTLSKDDIQGDYDFDIEVGSTRPVNQEVRKRDIMQLANQFGNHPMVNQEWLARQILEAFEIKDIEGALKPMEQVAQEQQQGQESAIAAEVAIDKPKRDTDLLKTQMKTEQAERESVRKDGQIKESNLISMLSALKDSRGGE